MIPIDAFKHRLAVAALSAALFAGSASAANGYLGIQVSAADNGARVTSVRDASPAAEAGLQADDIVLAIDGKEIKSADDMITEFGTRQAGDKITLKLQRGSETMEKSVTLRARPDDILTPTPAAAPAKAQVAKPTAEAPVAAKVEAAPSTTVVAAAPSAPAQIKLDTTEAAKVKVVQGAPTTAATDDAAPRKGGFLGVTLDTESGPGNVILDVRPEGPAARAELRAGDKITSIAGKPVTNGDAVSEILSDIEPGQKVEVAIERDGKKKLRTVKLGKYSEIAFEGAMQLAPNSIEPMPTPPAPAAPVASDERGWLGVYLGETEKGALVESTVDDSPARKAGLKDGDKIMKFGDRVISSPDDIMSAVADSKPGKKVELMVERNGKKETLTVKLGKRPADMAVAVAPAKPIEEPSAEIKAKVQKELEKARGEAEKARARAEKLVAEERAKADEEIAKARKLVEKTKKEVEETAQKAKKEAREESAKARVAAKPKTDRAEAVKKTAKQMASAISGWFFPAGESAEIRVEKKDDGFWVTTGSGKTGVMVPHDGSTTLTLKGGDGGVQIVPPSANNPHAAMDTMPSTMNWHSGEDGKAIKLSDGHPLVLHKLNDGTHEVTITKACEDGAFVVHPEGSDGTFTFKVDGMNLEGEGAAKFFVMKDGNLTPGAGSIEILKSDEGGKAKQKEKREVVVETVKKGDVHVVPHPPIAAGGGIVINNNGGTVIIGDSIARDFLRGHGLAGHDILIDKTIAKDDKKEKLKKLGYEIEVKEEKKAEKKKAKKDDS